MNDPAMTLTRLQRIEREIQRCTDRKLIRVLNRAWWAEVLHVSEVERKAA